MLAIIALLAVSIFAALQTARAKARYGTTLEQMRLIGAAVQKYEAINSSWPPGAATGTDPGLVASGDLAAWPTPRCSGWNYDYDYGVVLNNVRIELVNPSGVVWYHYCIHPSSGCGIPDATQINNKPTGKLDC